MLGNTNATANIAVKDLATAKKFYEGTLGLKQVDAEGDEVIVMKSGDTLINVYRSQFAGTNKATAVTWTVGDEIGSIVKALKDKGVAFEHYDMPGTDARRRHPCRLRHEGRLVQGSGRQHPEPDRPVGRFAALAPAFVLASAGLAG